MSSNHIIDMLCEYYFIKGYKDACKEILLEMEYNQAINDIKTKSNELKNEYYDKIYNNYGIDLSLKRHIRSSKFWLGAAGAISTGIFLHEDFDLLMKTISDFNSLTDVEKIHLGAKILELIKNIGEYWLANKKKKKTKEYFKNEYKDIIKKFYK